MRIAGSVALLLLVTVSAPAAQQAGSAPGAAPRQTMLRGVVLDAENDTPLRNARITVNVAPQRTVVVMSDSTGAFSMPLPTDVALLLNVIRAGYASPNLHVTPEQLHSGARMEIRLARAAVITGRVASPSGEPVNVTSLMIRQLNTDGRPPVARLLATQPDDRGEFRIGGLTAGRYVIDGIVIDGIANVLDYRLTPVTVDLEAGTETAVSLGFERIEPGTLTMMTPSGSVIVQGKPSPAALPPKGSSIRGRVVTTEGAPVAGATVVAERRGSSPFARTDALGRFVVQGVTPGSYTVRATKPGHVMAEHGRRGDDLPAAPVIVEADKDVDDLTIVLPRASVVSGHVFDEFGDALQAVSIRFMPLRRSPTDVGAVRDQGAYTVATDDRGQFRVGNIAPGDYILSASLPEQASGGVAGPRTAYTPVYYPEVHDVASATPLRVGRAEDIAGISITMRRVPVARVSGVARNASGAPLSGSIWLTPGQSPAGMTVARRVQAEPSGEFVFDGVTAGEYLVRAAGNGPAGIEFAVRAITVSDRDLEPIELRTSAGSSLRGRFVLEGDTDGVLWGYSMAAAPDDGAWTAGSTSNLGAPLAHGEAFSLTGLVGPTRLRISSEDENWYLKSVVIDGFDTVDRPFDFGFDGRAHTDAEVTFSKLGASIAGTAADDRARPVRDYAVYVFPTDRDGWFAGSRRVKLVRASADGSFRVRSLPPGDYWIAAVGRIDSGQRDGDWDPDLFDTLSARAMRITLGEAEARTLTVRLVKP